MARECARVIEPQQGDDDHLVRCPSCAAPDHWVSIYERDATTHVVWDCHCDRCGHEWTEDGSVL